MRILMIMMEGHGGMYQYGALLANALTGEHEVYAIVPTGSETNFFDKSVRVTEFPVGDTKVNFLPRFFRPDRMARFVGMINNIRPDVIHFHNPYNPWPCPIFPWLRKYRIVTTIPEGKLHRGMDKRFEMFISRAIYVHLSDALIVLSERDRELLGKWALGRKTHTINHGVNSLFIKLTDKQLPEGNNVLFFGRALPFKGLEYLLKAFAIVKERVPGVKLMVAGRLDPEKFGPLLAPLGDRVEVDNRFIPPDVAGRYLQSAKLVVLPYIEDDHSGLIPLVYYFGKPVVASSLVDMVEHGKTGLVVPPRDEGAMAEAIIALLTNEDVRTEMKGHVKRKVEEELSWQVIAGKTFAVYKELIES
ncbi:MAG: glycosyltransferase family 4 protein [Chloroflexi bacterium]|nr:glycosyltransferase family 4 protein [Chloroflexota bacterium]